jgi:hypothetical protein
MICQVREPGASPVDQRRPTRITIEFDAEDPVSGRILAASGNSDSFAGWLDLLTLLQAMHNGGSAERTW